MSVFLYERVPEKILRFFISWLVDSSHLTGPTEKKDFKMDKGGLHLSGLNRCIRET